MWRSCCDGDRHILSQQGSASVDPVRSVEALVEIRKGVRIGLRKNGVELVEDGGTLSDAWRFCGCRGMGSIC
jgi:hypothetical protein